MMWIRSSASLILGTCFAALAVAQHSDVEVDVNEGTLTIENRVVEGEFGEAPNPANVADEPGFDAEDGTMVPGATLEFDTVDLLGSSLWYWSGSDVASVTFESSPHELTLQHPITNASMTLTSADSGGQSGFLVGVADSEGGVHQDIDCLGATPPANGVYLFGLELTSDSYATSEPVYFVLAAGVDELVHEAAVDWVGVTFGVPEPAGLAWIGWGILLAGLRRRSL